MIADKPLFATRIIDPSQTQPLLTHLDLHTFDSTKPYAIFYAGEHTFVFLNLQDSVAEHILSLSSLERIRVLSKVGGVVGSFAGLGDQGCTAVIRDIEHCRDMFTWELFTEDGTHTVAFQRLVVEEALTQYVAPCPVL